MVLYVVLKLADRGERKMRYLQVGARTDKSKGGCGLACRPRLGPRQSKRFSQGSRVKVDSSDRFGNRKQIHRIGRPAQE